MNQSIVHICRALGLLLLLVTATSSLLPTTETSSRTEALALRQIGHNYLLEVGDSTTRVPAVTTETDGQLTLALATNVNYELLNQTARHVLLRYGIQRDYTLSLADCTTGEIFLGSLWPAPSPLDVAGAGEAACTGRDQETRCANIGLAFADRPEQGPPVWTWMLGGLGLLLLLVPVRRPQPDSPGLSTDLAPAPAPQPVAMDAAIDPLYQLAPGITFAQTSGVLTVADQAYELTHREAKLLLYFLEHPNQVLPRQEINDAVWGTEGIITGRSLDVFVSRLRKKLAHAGTVEIKTVHGVGYQLLTS